MIHYIYKTSDDEGNFYIGRHSTTNINDGYLGSGTWVRKHVDKNNLQKTILEFCESFDELIEKEQSYIAEYFNDPKNKNFNNNSVGTAVGLDNISHRDDVKKKARERMLRNNPMKNGHSLESREKIRLSVLGENNPFYGKQHSDDTKKRIGKKNKGKIWSDNQRKNLSEVRKKQFNGEKPAYLIFAGHSEESKEKIRQSSLKRDKIECPFCKKLAAPHVAKRWHFDNCKQKTEMGI